MTKKLFSLQDAYKTIEAQVVTTRTNYQAQYDRASKLETRVMTLIADLQYKQEEIKKVQKSRLHYLKGWKALNKEFDKRGIVAQTKIDTSIDLDLHHQKWKYEELTDLPLSDPGWKDPPMFSGSKAQWENWKSQLKLKIKKNYLNFPIEWDKIEYARSRCSDKAFDII